MRLFGECFYFAGLRALKGSILAAADDPIITWRVESIEPPSHRLSSESARSTAPCPAPASKAAAAAAGRCWSAPAAAGGAAWCSWLRSRTAMRCGRLGCTGELLR